MVQVLRFQRRQTTPLLSIIEESTNRWGKHRNKVLQLDIVARAPRRVRTSTLRVPLSFNGLYRGPAGTVQGLPSIYSQVVLERGQEDITVPLSQDSPLRDQLKDKVSWLARTLADWYQQDVGVHIRHGTSRIPERVWNFEATQKRPESDARWYALFRDLGQVYEPEIPSSSLEGLKQCYVAMDELWDGPKDF